MGTSEPDLPWLHRLLRPHHASSTSSAWSLRRTDAGAQPKMATTWTKTRHQSCFPDNDSWAWTVCQPTCSRTHRCRPSAHHAPSQSTTSATSTERPKDDQYTP